VKHGYTFISDHDLVRILHGELDSPKGAVWLSLDDGFKELLQNVIPLICKRTIPITLFIPSGIIDGPGLFPWLHQSENANGAPRSNALAETDVRDSLTATDVVEICRFGHVSIGSHTVWHTVTANLSDEQIRSELAESRRELESLTRRTVECFAYPEGRLNGREGRWLTECGYQLAATTEATFVRRETNPFLVPRFHVADNIWLPEAICNIVGVWRPAIDPLQRFLRLCKAAIHRSRYTSGRQHRVRPEISA
jgi:peptidoglycan/xylan/chitin deacetylase (PgdA/CDA1 family)